MSSCRSHQQGKEGAAVPWKPFYLTAQVLSASNGGWPRACARAGVHHPQYDGRHHDRLGPCHGLPGLRHAPPEVGIPGDVQMPISARAPRRPARTSWCWPRIPAGPPGSSHLQGGQVILKRCIWRKRGGAPQNIEHYPVHGPAAARLLRHQCLRGSAGKLRTVSCFMHRSSHSRTTWYEWILDTPTAGKLADARFTGRTFRGGKISQRRVVGVFLPRGVAGQAQLAGGAIPRAACRPAVGCGLAACLSLGALPPQADLRGGSNSQFGSIGADGPRLARKLLRKRVGEAGGDSAPWRSGGGLCCSVAANESAAAAAHEAQATGARGRTPPAVVRRVPRGWPAAW